MTPSMEFDAPIRIRREFLLESFRCGPPYIEWCGTELPSATSAPSNSAPKLFSHSIHLIRFSLDRFGFIQSLWRSDAVGLVEAVVARAKRGEGGGEEGEEEGVHCTCKRWQLLLGHDAGTGSRT